MRLNVILPYAVAAGAVVLSLNWFARAQDAEQALSAADRDRLLHETALTPVIVQPPVVRVGKDEMAIIGASDGQYYVVHYKDELITTQLLYPDNRSLLYWRDVNE